MKIRDRLKRKIRNDLWLFLFFIACAVISLAWLQAMPKIFIFLAGGVIFLLVEIGLLFIKYRKADPLMDEIEVDPVVVREVNEKGIVLEGRDPLPWSEINEIRKVYRAIGSIFAFLAPLSNAGVTRRFFYVIRLRSGEWLELSNANRMAFKGSFKKQLTQSPDFIGLLKRFLVETGRHPHIRLICHNEAMARFEALDLRKEIEDLLRWKKK